MNRQFRNRALSGMMAALMVFSAVGTSVMDVYASAQDVPAASAEAESTVSTAEDGIQVQIDENGTVIEETANVQNETEVQAEAVSEEGAAEAVPEAADEAYSAASYAEETDTGDSASEVTDDKARAADKAKDASKDAEEDVVEEAVDETNPNTLSESHKAFIRLLGGAIGIDPEYYIASAEQSRDFPLVGAIDSDGWRFVADASDPVTIYLTEDESDVRYYNTSGDFGTYYRSVQLGDYHGSGNAICVMPSLGSNGPGYYNAYPITNSAMRKLMYYAPGCYGYEHSYDAQVAYVVVGEGNQYVYWHLVASYALELIANGGDASQTTDWAKELADFQYDVVLQICSQILGLPDPPEDFRCYIFPTSADAQAIAFFTGYEPQNGSLSLRKAPVSGSEECVKDNPCYSLEGAAYELHNAETDALVGTFTVNADGTTNKITDIPAGDYYVIETAAGKGYKLDTEKHSVSIAANENKTFEVFDEPYMDPIGIEIYKEDAETGGKASGGASLAGAQFEIRYYNNYCTKDTLPGSATRTWTVQTVERNGKYRAQLLVDECILYEQSDAFYEYMGNKEVPLGTIAVVETKAPTGYQLPADPVLTVQQITPEYITKVISEGNASATIEEKPIRGDITLTKVDEYGEKLAGIPWLITSDTTGESHIVVTDAEGKVDTAALLSANAGKANANDAAYANGRIDESRLDAAAPVWFGEGTPAKKGAFLFDTYTITELSCSANAGMSMITKKFTIRDNGKTVSLGEIVNTGGEVKIRTTATDSVTKTHFGTKAETAVIHDVVKCEGLTVGKEYKLTGTLYDKLTGDVIKDASGKAVTAEKTFTATAEKQNVTVSFTFDSTIINTTAVVVGEDLYRSGRKISTHFDLTDEAQAVYYPEIGTTLKDAATEEHISLASEHTVNVDTISYKGMIAGKTYTSAGFLADPETGHALKKDGTVSGLDVLALYAETAGRTREEAISGLIAKAKAEGLLFATADFTADAANGTAAVTFEYDSTPFTGKKVVAAEAVYDEKAGPIAVHFDPADEEQTVWIPKLITKAAGKDTGSRAIAASADSVITDTVTWSGVKAETTLKTVAEAYLKGGTAAEDKLLASAAKEVTVNAETGSFKVNITVDATGLEGREIYIVERCYLVNDAGENLVGEHADREDEKQTVIVPGLGTTLTDAETREHISLASRKTVQIDTIAYEGLIAGKNYTSVGFLADPETGYALKADGTTYAELDIVSIYKSASGSSKEEVIASLIKTAEDNSLLYATAEFTADAAEGEATVTFEYDSTPFAGREVVAAESIYDEKGKPIAVHFDPKDEDQTVWIPKIATKAAGDNGEKVLPEDVTDVAIKDTLTWEGVKAQTTFKVVTKAFAKGETKEDDVLLADTSAEPKVITASGETGTASIIVKVDTTGHGGKSIYISEYCYLETPDGDKLIGKHEGRNDKAQTVSVPHIGTVLEDAVTKGHISFVEKEVTQKDTINYDGLVKGKDYTAVGIMTDRETGFALVKGGGTYTGKAVTALYDPKAPAADTIALLESINVIYATADFTAEDTKGQAEVVFTYDAVPFAGGAAVAAEAIYPFGKEPVAVHFSPTDEDQTVWFPEIVTKAVDKADGTKLIAADKDAVILDTLTWKGVKADTEFTITAKAFVKGATAEEDVQIGKEVTKTVTAKTETGSVDVEIPIDASELAGKQVYITELCTIVNKDGETVPVGEHADRTDEDQTVTVPEIGTTLVDEKTELHVSYPGEKTVQKDTIKYSGLIAGETYPAIGILADPETGKAFKKDGTVYDGAEVLDLMKAEDSKDKTAAEKAEAIKAGLEAEGILYATSEFKAEGTEGEALVTFEYDGRPFRGRKVVAAEAVYEEGEPLAIHFVPTDEDQTVSFPELITTAENAVSGAKTVFAGKDQKIKDTVKWTGITAPTTYSLTTAVFVKGATEAEDKQIAEATETFEVTEAEGTYAVEIPVDLTGLDGSVVYITEKIDLVKKGEGGEDELVPVTDHVDRDDEDQSVSVPEIGTTLLDKKTETHNTFAEKEVVNVDTILFKGLEAGRTYTAVGILANPATGCALMKDGKDFSAKTIEELGKAEGKTAEERTAAIIAALKEAGIIYATAEFVPEAADGSATVEFTYDATVFAGRRVVAAESVFEENGELVAVHFDMEDEAQMVNIPKIGTTAVDGADGDKKVLESAKATIKDTIAYESITPGTELTAVAVVYDKATGKPILVNGKEVTATADFTAEKENGTTVVSITIDATGRAGKSLVVSEKVYLKGTDKLVAEHTDMKDAAQTVTVYKNTTPPPSTSKKSSTTTAKSVKTGDNMGVLFAGIVLIAALGAGFAVLARRKKRA